MSPGDQVELIFTGVQPLNNTPASSAAATSSSSINALPGDILGMGVISSVTLAPNGGNTLVDLIVSGKAVPVITTAAANNDISLARRS
jgi:gamma-glutamyl phosphate reductase